MGGIPQKALDTKYKKILSRERSWANSVARSVIKLKPISVWEFMIPIIFIMNYAKYKNEREVFIKNLLFTKELALKAALDMMKRGRSRGAIRSSVEEKTRNLLTSVSEEIYSEEIRRNQLKEIDLLIDHYCELLRVEGEDYDTLMINAYQGRENYLTFLEQLKKAEKEVNLAALKTLGSRGNAELVSKMEEATDRLRMASARRLFGSGN